MNDTTPSPADPPRRVRAAVIVGVLVLGALGVAGWKAWQLHGERSRAERAAESSQWQGLETRLDTLRADLRAQSQRLQDAAATNRVLRDEVLALGQREALLEDSLGKLNDNTRRGSEALHLDEVASMLALGERRLRIAGDLDGARRAYALAASTLAGIDDPRLLNLRQSLADERAALDALGPGPLAAVQDRLDALDAALARLPTTAAPLVQPPAWQRLIAPLVQVRPAQTGPLTDTAGRTAALDALQVEITLTRAAAERGDAAGYRHGLRRIDAGLLRLWPDSPARRGLRQTLATLGARPLRPEAPLLGATLQQLRSLRDGRNTP